MKRGASNHILHRKTIQIIQLGGCIITDSIVKRWKRLTVNGLIEVVSL